jgi:hypothetical protein
MSPAGGGGNGRFTSLLPAGRHEIVALQGRVVVTREPEPMHLTNRQRVFDGVMCILAANTISEDFVGYEVLRETGHAIKELLGGLLAGLGLTLIMLAIPTALGAAAGGALAALGTLGVGTGAGIAFGAQVGFQAGMAWITYLGLGFLVIYLKDKGTEIYDLSVEGVKTAWSARAYDKGSVWRAGRIDKAARLFARAKAVFIRIMLEGFVAFLLAKGAGRVAEQIGPLLKNLRKLEWAQGLADWLELHYPDLLKDPRLNPAAEGGTAPKPEGSASKPAPSRPSQTKPATESKVKRVGGRKPRNSKYAGQKYPPEKLPPDVRKKYPESVNFTEEGFPDFKPYEKTSVKVEGLTGENGPDFRKANQAAGYKRTPEGYTWHHNQDGKTMQLVPTDLHDAVPHTGGAAILRSQNP